MGVGRRRDQADRDFGGGLVAMLEPENKALHAARTRGKKPAKLHDQPPRGEEQRLGLGDFGGKLHARSEPGRRGQEIPRAAKPPPPAAPPGAAAPPPPPPAPPPLHPPHP